MQRSVGLALAAATLFGWLVAENAAASPAVLAIDETQSSLTVGGVPQPLSGLLQIDLGADPPLAGNTRFDVTGLSASGAGLTVGLDGSLSNPGLGLLRPDGTFLIPALFLEVGGLGSPLALTLIDVEGTYDLSTACAPGVLCLETAFQIDTLGPDGVIDVSIVAAVPEPSTAALVALGLFGLAAARRREGTR